MRFAIYGSGGLGGYYGARLQQAGHRVGFIARGEHLAAIRERGLQILSPAGDAHLESVAVSSDPADIGPVDVVIVAVKTWQVTDAAHAMRPMIEPHTLVIPFLNGVDAPIELADVLGKQHVLGGLSKIFSLIEAPGVIRHLSAGAYLEVGEMDGRISDRVTSLANTFRDAGVDAECTPDIQLALWKKLLMVSSWSGIGALARSPLGVVRARPALRSLVDQSMAEGVAVARALGHAVEDAYKAELWQFYDGLPDDTTSSMWRDIIAARPSELDAWNGAVVRYGERSGVATPVHHTVYELLRPMERRARGEQSRCQIS